MHALDDLPDFGGERVAVVSESLGGRHRHGQGGGGAGLPKAFPAVVTVGRMAAACRLERRHQVLHLFPNRLLEAFPFFVMLLGPSGIEEQAISLAGRLQRGKLRMPLRKVLQQKRPPRQRQADELIDGDLLSNDRRMEIEIRAGVGLLRKNERVPQDHVMDLMGQDASELEVGQSSYKFWIPDELNAAEGPRDTHRLDGGVGPSPPPCGDVAVERVRVQERSHRPSKLGSSQGDQRVELAVSGMCVHGRGPVVFKSMGFE